MDTKILSSTSPSAFRQTLLKSSALFRACAAAATALVALASGVHLGLASVREELQPLTSKWKWIFFASALTTCIMVVFCLRFYFRLREINTEKRRRAIRLFIITCVCMAVLELIVGGHAFLDSRSPVIAGGTDEPRGSSEGLSFVIVYCLCLLLFLLEVVSMIIALTCVKSQLYSQIASAKESGDVVEYERRPSSVGVVVDTEFTIEKIDDGASGAEAEEQPLKQDDVDRGHAKVPDTMLVNNDLYEVPAPLIRRPKQTSPPLAPAKDSETSSGASPPLPTSPIPDEVDRPTSPKSPTFPRYERGSQGKPPTSPIFPRYVDTRFAHYNPQQGTFLRPRIAPGDSFEPAKEQEAS
ncbi:uncharacterized protein LOC100904602 [Galendromus occidentalis]|uniref:Uncharacterized protein LOC100904602 n=1 Tax=Galendromus occidentalis TaxID=34638 RepID=A0AAJ6QQB6_9ACAR|nr:uncharacterized protein LOC100904602 [Galendromus occidentalis]